MTGAVPPSWFFVSRPRLSLCPGRQENKDEKELRKSKLHGIIIRMRSGLSQPDVKAEARAPAAGDGHGRPRLPARCRLLRSLE